MENDLLFEKAKQKALRLLSIRARSIEELKKKLTINGFSECVIKKVIDRFVRLKYLDDEVFAIQWARNLAVNKLWGNKKIEASLREKGISRELIDQSITETRQEIKEEAALKRLIEKKFRKKIISRENLKVELAKEKRRMMRNLLAKGFPPWLILEALERFKKELTNDIE